ncbi:MAG TPA: ABC transporter ATP-binding protein [Acidimicrobiales bacterium]|nr:ABC transporter ATP-binding protein [Acidimicrobiales bacterium]
MAEVLSVEGVVKDYRRGVQTVRALDGVSVTVDAGEFVAVLGPSGSGKSTLLHLMGALDAPTAGSVRIGGVDVAGLSDDDLTDLRRHRLGFVFQFFNLLPTLSAWENVAVPLLLDGRRLRSLKGVAAPLLEALGLGHRVDHRPAELSGGELQRVAIARALIADPIVVLADEPTGNLDSETGAAVLDVLRGSCAERGAAVVMVTHDRRGAAVADRSVYLVDGRLAAAPVAS